MKRWTLDDGLPGNHVTGISQGPDGYLWVSTTEDVARFNGYEFERFKSLGDVSKGRVFDILADAEGRIWTSRGRHGLLLFDSGSVRVLSKEEGNPGPASIQFGQPLERSTMFTADVGGRPSLYQFHEGKFRDLYNKERPPWVRIRSVLEAPTEGYWLMDADDRLFLLAEGQVREATLPSGFASDLFRMNDGRPALVVGKTVCALQSDGLTWMPVRTVSPPLSHGTYLGGVCEDNGGNIWISSSLGLLALDQDGVLRKVSLPSSEVLGRTKNLLEDREGNIWLGTVNGLVQISYTPFVTWTRADGMPESRLVTLGEDGEGTIWFACHGGLGYLGRDDGRVTDTGKRSSYHEYVAVADPEEGVWLSNLMGDLEHWRRGGFERVPGPEVPGHPDAQRIGLHVSGLGDVWVCMNHGLFRLPADRKGAAFEQVFLEGNPLVKQLIEDHHGRTYALTNAHVYLKTSKGAWKRLGSRRPGTPRKSYALAVDEEDFIWIIGLDPDALGCWNGVEWSFVLLKEIGLDNISLQGVAINAEEVWLSTYADGILCIDRSALLEKMNNLSQGSKPLTVRRFNKSDGLATLGGSFVPQGTYKARDGRIWFATMEGASVVAPANLRERIATHVAPPIHVEKVFVDGVRRIGERETPAFRDELIIEPAAERIEIRFAAISLGAPENIQYRYRLAGHDTDWVEAGTRRFAFYERPPAGAYRFAVMATDRFGTWHGNTGSLAVRVKPMWWERKTTKSFGVLLGSLLLVAFYFWAISSYRRRHALQEAFSRQLLASQESERKRIATELHDSLGQDLLLIKNATEMRLMGIGEEVPIQDKLAEITDLASHAISEVRAVTENLRPPELDRLGLAVAIEAMADKVSEHFDVDVRCDVGVLAGRCRPDHEIQVFRIVQESVNNAIKHADASVISITASLLGSGILLTVEDDGKGMPPDVLDRKRDGSGKLAHLGIGLGGMRERISLLDGTMRIEIGKIVKGTKLLFHFPHPDR
ncbi:MAG TPA: two-component regulator propeller domain-containing protein [Verrucomicrobiales bacterium]|nr:two-component regulator propeller domain-containing protein [Verrucomicrobiales bacterium]